MRVEVSRMFVLGQMRHEKLRSERRVEGFGVDQAQYENVAIHAINWMFWIVFWNLCSGSDAS